MFLDWQMNVQRVSYDIFAVKKSLIFAAPPPTIEFPKIVADIWKLIGSTDALQIFSSTWTFLKHLKWKENDFENMSKSSKNKPIFPLPHQMIGPLIKISIQRQLSVSNFPMVVMTVVVLSMESWVAFLQLYQFLISSTDVTASRAPKPFFSLL